jgi:hypothetical protein
LLSTNNDELLMSTNNDELLMLMILYNIGLTYTFNTAKIIVKCFLISYQVAAALLFGDKIDQVSGVELLTDLYESSVTAVTSYNQLIQSPELDKLFESRQSCHLSVFDGDFLVEPYLSQWTNSDIVFANSTCFDHDLMQKIADFGIKMKSGSRFISFTSSLPSSLFAITEKINLGMR